MCAVISMDYFFIGNNQEIEECYEVVCYQSWCPNNCISIMWECPDNTCIHKSLFPLNYTDIFMILLLTLTSTLSALSGVGGGALDTLIIMIIGDFPIEMAVPLSLCGIFGTSVIKFCYFVMRRNPLNLYQYLPSYKIIFVFVPLYGTFSYIGYLLNKYSPFLLTMTVLFCVILFSIYKTSVRLYQIYSYSVSKVKKERTEIDGIYDVLVEKDTIKSENVEYFNDYYKVMVSSYEVRLYSVMQKYTKWWNVTICNLVCLGVNLTLVFFINTRKYFVSYEIIIYFVQFVLTVLFVILVCCINYYKRSVKDALIGNIINTFKLVVASSITGVVSSYVGIGGGMILNPFLVSMKIVPHVVVATYSVATFYSVSVTLFQYLLFNNFDIFYGLIVFFTGLVGSLIGVSLLHHFKNQKLILWAMMVCFVLSLFAVCFSIISSLPLS